MLGHFSIIGGHMPRLPPKVYAYVGQITVAELAGEELALIKDIRKPMCLWFLAFNSVLISIFHKNHILLSIMLYLCHMIIHNQRYKHSLLVSDSIIHQQSSLLR